MTTDPWGTVTGPTAQRERGDAEQRALVPRDQYDRYLMKNEDGSMPKQGRTRVSTTKAALSNTIGIQKWNGRRIVDGFGSDTAVVEQAMRISAMPDGKEKEQALGKLADRAFHLGGGKDRSGKGTEFHELTEDINRGTHTQTVAPHLVPELDAYFQMLSDHDIRILPDMLERNVLCPFNQAGTFDNMVEMWNPETEEYELLVADLKTGRDLEKGWLEILIQLWNYANAYAMWTTTRIIYSSDPEHAGKIVDLEGFYEPMPRELRTDKALIFHVPLDGTAQPIILDISGVERWVRAAVEAKRANAEAKLKVRKLAKVAPPAFVAPAETAEQIAARVPGLSYEAAQSVVNGIAAQPLLDPIAAADFTGQMPGSAPLPRQVTPMPVGVIACGPDQPTAGDIAVVQEFAEHLQSRPQVTPQMAEGERVAAERLAAARASTAAVVAAAPADAAAVQQDSYQLTPAPSAEHDPVTSRKKRACGHCRKPGHTQKNCPENPASAKYVPPLAAAAVAELPTDKLTVNPTAFDDTVSSASMVLSPEGPTPGLYVSSPDAMPYCPGPATPGHGDWTSTDPRAPGRWVCVTCGKPAEAAWRAQQAAPDPDEHQLDGHAGGAWPPAEVSDLSKMIAACTSSNAVLALRSGAILDSAWSADLDRQAQAKHSDLMLQGR